MGKSALRIFSHGYAKRLQVVVKHSLKKQPARDLDIALAWIQNKSNKGHMPKVWDWVHSGAAKCLERDEAACREVKAKKIGGLTQTQKKRFICAVEAYGLRTKTLDVMKKTDEDFVDRFFDALFLTDGSTQIREGVTEEDLQDALLERAGKMPWNAEDLRTPGSGGKLLVPMVYCFIAVPEEEESPQDEIEDPPPREQEIGKATHVLHKPSGHSVLLNDFGLGDGFLDGCALENGSSQEGAELTKGALRVSLWSFFGSRIPSPYLKDLASGP